MCFKLTSGMASMLISHCINTFRNVFSNLDQYSLLFFFFPYIWNYWVKESFIWTVGDKDNSISLRLNLKISVACMLQLDEPLTLINFTSVLLYSWDKLINSFKFMLITKISHAYVQVKTSQHKLIMQTVVAELSDFRMWWQ